MQIQVHSLLLNQEKEADVCLDWDDEVRDKKVGYMLDLINDGHVFRKTDWPGGDDSFPLITYKKKSPYVVHKKHVLSRKPKRSHLRKRKNASCPSIRKASHRKQRTMHDYFRDAPTKVEEIPAWVQSTLHDFAETIAVEQQALADQQSRLERQVKAMRCNRFAKLSKRRSSLMRSSQKRRNAPDTTGSGAVVSEAEEADTEDVVAEDKIRDDKISDGMGSQEYKSEDAHVQSPCGDSRNS